MKRMILMFAVAALLSITALGQTKTVTDYFLALPGKYYSRSGSVTEAKELAAYRTTLISVKDEKNGYLKLQGVDFEGWGEIALFKKNDGSYVIGHAEVGCGPACGGDVTFWTYKSGIWKEVTDTVFQWSGEQTDKVFNAGKIPEEDRISYFELPRQGKTMRLVCDSCTIRGSATIARFRWNGVRFVKL